MIAPRKPGAQGLSRDQQNLLADGLRILGLSIEAPALLAMESYLAQVLKWRDRINLVSVEDGDELITRHALDSLSLLPLLENSERVLDIGTGAGFPGMLLAAARPNIHFTLLDSRQRRIEFLRMVNAGLGLANISLVCTRAEQLLPDRPQSNVQPEANFDTLVARAVASLRELIDMTAGLRTPGQRLIAMKGQYPRDEIAGLEAGAENLRIRSIRVDRLEVPFLDADRHAVVVEF